VRNFNKAKQQQKVGLDETENIVSNLPRPDQLVVNREELQQLAEKMQLLPHEQREVIILHLKGEIKFKTIANLQDVSINTVQSRYRYGLEKLRSLFD
jgi:RNA polymerase sigma-70 factor (ECF subfamily)